MPSGPDTTAEADTGGPAADVPESGPTHAPGRPPQPACTRPSEGRGTGSATAAVRLERISRLPRFARGESPRAALAVLGGLALAAAFPPYGLWPLSLAAVAVLSLLTRGRTARQGAWSGFVLGLAFFLGLLKWLHVIGWDAVIGLSVLQAFFLVPLGAGLAATSRLPLWPLWGACLWVAEEWARDRIPFGGFPWGRLAFANTGSPYTPLAALGGAPLVTFAVAATGTLLAAAALAVWRLRRAPGPAVRTALPAAGSAALAAALMCAGYAVPIPTAADDTVDIAVVQGNVQQPGMDFLGRPMLILDNHVDATVELADDVRAGRTARPDLVIWPENASDLDPFRSPEANAAIERAVRAIGVPVLVGALVEHPTKEGYVENQGIVWDPENGPGDSYTKRHPVPFGEYVPFRDQLSKVITRLDRVPRDFWPGEAAGVLQVGPARLGDIICFEVAYDEIVRDTVKSGARALVIQTNNATYGNTGQPEQQLAMSRLRSMEHGRAIVTAAPSGISAIVSPDGTIAQRTEEFTQDVLIASLPLRDGITLADRVGPSPEWAFAMAGALSWAMALVLGRRGRVRDGMTALRDERGRRQ